MILASQGGGYAIDNEEHEADVRCVAVPIWNYRQKVVGAISVSGPAGRIDRAMAERGLVAKVKEAGHAISSRLAGDMKPKGQEKRG